MLNVKCYIKNPSLTEGFLMVYTVNPMEPMNVQALTDDSFKKEVLESEMPVLVDFWAAWCQPCKMVSPIIDELAEEYKGKIKVAKMDVDAHPQNPGTYGIMSIPTVMLFKAGKPAAMMIGVQPKSVYKEKIDAVIAS